jgi:hypothetical protein
VHLLHNCRGLPADVLAGRADLMKTRALEVAYANGVQPLKQGLATTTAEKWSASFTTCEPARGGRDRRQADDRSLTTVATRLPLPTRHPVRAARDALCRPLESGHAVTPPAFPPCTTGR